MELLAAEGAAWKEATRLLPRAEMLGMVMQPEATPDRRASVSRAYRWFFGIMGLAFVGLGLYASDLAFNNTPIWLAAGGSFVAAAVLLTMATLWDPAWLGPPKQKP